MPNGPFQSAIHPRFSATQHRATASPEAMGDNKWKPKTNAGFYFFLKILAVLKLMVCKVSSEGVILSSLNYDVEISSRMALTMVRATFENRGLFRSAETLQLLLPEEVFISSLSMDANGKTYTSTITKRKRGQKGNDASNANIIRLSKRAARAQKLEIEAQLEPKENFTVNVKYTYLLRRKRGLYHLLLYLPKKKPHDVNLDINIRMMGEMRNITFLEAEGEEKPMKVIQRGTAEVFSPNDRELQLKYKRSIYSHSQFASVTHYNPMLRFSRPKTPASRLSFKPSNIPRLFLADPTFVLSFDVERFPDGGNIQIENGYFVHFLSPEGLPKLPVHTVFMLDISGSMDEFGKLENLKMAMETTLQRMKEEDSFEIFVFSTNVKSLGTYTGTPHDIVRSTSKINLLRAYGGTNINDALLDSVYGAIDYKKTKGIKQIVFLTDGNRTVGELDSKLIRKGLKEVNVEKIPIYALAFGNDADMKFLRQMSGENRGFVRKIRSTGRPADQFEGFYEEISTPLMKDLSVEYSPDEVEEDSVVKLGQDSYYSGDEVVLAGKLKGDLTSVTSKVTAYGANGRIQLKVSRDDILSAPEPNKEGVLERIWAYLSVQDLLSAEELIDDKNVRKEHRDRALEIALMYNFVTRLTSLNINEFSNWTAGEILIKDQAVGNNIGELTLKLVSPEDFAATLPDGLRKSLAPTQNRRFSFVDNDPHFVVQVAGLALPLCFDLHGQPGDALSLVRDDVSGLIVNAEVSAALGKPGATYFTRLFISLKRLNLTITTESISISCLLGKNENEVSEIWHDTDMFNQRWKKRARRRKQILNSYKRFNRRRRKRLRRDIIHHKHRLRHCFYCQVEKNQKYNNKIYRKREGEYEDEEDEEQDKESEEQELGNLEDSSNPLKLSDSPVIDAYLEKDHEMEKIQLNHKPVKIRPRLPDSNLSWEEYRKYVEDFQTKGLVNHFLNSYPMNKGNNLIFRNSITNVPPKNGSLFQESKPINHECNKEFRWQHLGQRRYDDVVLTARGRRRRQRLDVIVNDVNLHVVVTNTRNRNGQAFLGFYIQEQKIMSPNTTGVIGQFVYKSVGTIGHYPELYTNPEDHEDRTIPLVVIHLPQDGQRVSRVTRVAAVVSKRRSLLHRKKVLCLHVKKHGKGLLAKRSRAYVLRNLYS